MSVCAGEPSGEGGRLPVPSAASRPPGPEQQQAADAAVRHVERAQPQGAERVAQPAVRLAALRGDDAGPAGECCSYWRKECAPQASGRAGGEEPTVSGGRWGGGGGDLMLQYVIVVGGHTEGCARSMMCTATCETITDSLRTVDPYLSFVYWLILF